MLRNYYSHAIRECIWVVSPVNFHWDNPIFRSACRTSYADNDFSIFRTTSWRETNSTEQTKLQRKCTLLSVRLSSGLCMTHAMKSSSLHYGCSEYASMLLFHTSVVAEGKKEEKKTKKQKKEEKKPPTGSILMDDIPKWWQHRSIFLAVAAIVDDVVVSYIVTRSWCICYTHIIYFSWFMLNSIFARISVFILIYNHFMFGHTQLCALIW